MRFPQLARSAWAHLALLALGVAATYFHTLGVPFTLDDFSSIRENELIYRWQGLEPLWRYQPNRVVTYGSFAWNYRAGGFAVAGYHAVNLVIHFLAGVAVYGLARGLMRAPRVRTTVPAGGAPALPLLAALLFVLHPLHTQAVTYIVQRLASLVALLYLTSLAAYVQARLAESRASRTGWGLLCGLAGGLAFLAKENAATLPLAILLVELVGFAPTRARVAWTGAGAVAGLAVFAISVAIGHGRSPLAGSAWGALSQETTGITRGQYLLTQLGVVLHYFRLFLLPVGQHLDLNVALRRSLGDPGVALALAAHLVLLGAALLLLRRRPLVAFAILFAYLAHLVESSVIPIRDLAFEHRAYLPDAGLCLAAAWLLAVEARRRPFTARLAPALAAALLLALGLLTWRRNQLWNDPVAFWRTDAEAAPNKPRPWAMLGRALLDAGRPAEAAAALERAGSLRPADADASDAALDAINMAWALRRLGRHAEALDAIARARALPMTPADRATLAVNEGNVYFDQGRAAEAERAFREALSLAPGNLAARGNLASACAQQGKLEEAERLCLEVLRFDPGDRVTRINLWQVRAKAALERAEAERRSGRPGEALATYQRALEALEEVSKLSPEDSALQAQTRAVRHVMESLERR